MTQKDIIPSPDGTVEKYQDGKLHCEDGPAIVFADGCKGWFQNGEPWPEGPAEAAAIAARAVFEKEVSAEATALQRTIKPAPRAVFGKKAPSV